MTPLKKPITYTARSVESAILLSSILHCGHYLLPDIARNISGRGFLIPLGRLKRIAQSDIGSGQAGVDVAKDLLAQGIDWLTWEPPAPISVGEHAVEFKPDGVQVGCTFVSRETVLEIAKRLEAQ